MILAFIAGITALIILEALLMTLCLAFGKWIIDTEPNGFQDGNEVAKLAFTAWIGINIILIPLIIWLLWKI